MVQSPIFTTIRLNNIQLKNRIIKSATYEGLSVNGAVTDRLIDWHRQIVLGGVAMTTLAYCAVNDEGATFENQIVVNEASIDGLKSFTAAIHKAGGLCSIQLAHCGFFSRNKKLKSRPISPTRTFNNLGLFSGIPFSRTMTEDDIDSTLSDFAEAAVIAKESGFDAIELHAGHGYLLSQFLSPAFNRRKDDYGGSIEKRPKFPTEVLQSIRRSVGKDFPILIKMNVSDGFKGGLGLEDAKRVASTFEKAGVDGLVLSGGFTNTSPFFLLRGDIPIKQMVQVERNWLQKIGIMLFGPVIIKKLPFNELFFLGAAQQIRRVVNIPIVYIGGVTSLQNMESVLSDGFELIALGRPLIHDAQFINRLESGEVNKTGCTYCNQCIPEIDRDGVRCVL